MGILRHLQALGRLLYRFSWKLMSPSPLHQMGDGDLHSPERLQQLLLSVVVP